MGQSYSRPSSMPIAPTSMGVPGVKRHLST
jgi:hypothetical protein